MERATIILTRLYWTLIAIGSLQYLLFDGHTPSIIGWVVSSAALVTFVFCWLSYPWAWMAAGIIGFIVLAYQTYVAITFLAATEYGGWTNFTFSYGPIHTEGFVAKILCWGGPLFGFIITSMLAYFGARRSDAKTNA